MPASDDRRGRGARVLSLRSGQVGPRLGGELALEVLTALAHVGDVKLGLHLHQCLHLDPEHRLDPQGQFRRQRNLLIEEIEQCLTRYIERASRVHHSQVTRFDNITPHVSAWMTRIFQSVAHRYDALVSWSPVETPEPGPNPRSMPRKF